MYNGEMISMEAALLQELSEVPGIVRLVDHYKDDYEHIIVTEYVTQNVNLCLLAANSNRMPELAAKYFIGQLVNILSTMEEHGLFLSNFTSSHILVDEGRIYVADLSTAGFLKDSQNYARHMTAMLCKPPPFLLDNNFDPQMVTLQYLGILTHEMLFCSIPTSKTDMNLLWEEYKHSDECFDFASKCIEGNGEVSLEKLKHHPWLERLPSLSEVEKLLSDHLAASLVMLEEEHNQVGCRCKDVLCWIARGKPQEKELLPSLGTSSVKTW